MRRAARLLVAQTALLISTSAIAAPPWRTCLIVGVSDGDTITARCGAPGGFEQVKVRLAAVDAPERRQPFGARSKQALSDLTFGREALLECGKVDRYRRSVCRVVVPVDGVQSRRAQPVDVGLAMVSQGMAWWYRAYSKDQPTDEQARYAMGEQRARAAGAGLWADPNPVPPWDWRAAARGQIPTQQ